MTDDEILEMVKEYASEDLLRGWGHTIDAIDIKFTNQEGEEL